MSEEIDVVVAQSALQIAKTAAREISEGIANLSAFEKAVAKSQIAAITRLVKAVEAL